MRRYDKILVPYDGAVSTEHTVQTACRIARWNDSAVHVVVPLYPDAVSDGEREDIVSGVEAVCRREKLEMDVVFQGGRPSEAVIDVAYEKGNDLIVLGKTHMTGLEKLVVGSFTGRIINYSACDIIVIPESIVLRWRRILLCTDGSEYSEAAVEHAIGYARLHGGSISALSVVDVNDEFYALSPDGADRLIEKSRDLLGAIVEKAKDAGVGAKPYVKEGDAARKILELADETRADIIFMGSHERIGLGSLIMGSVARKVSMGAPCPVFIVKP